MHTANFHRIGLAINKAVSFEHDFKLPVAGRQRSLVFVWLRYYIRHSIFPFVGIKEISRKEKYDSKIVKKL